MTSPSSSVHLTLDLDASVEVTDEYLWGVQNLLDEAFEGFRGELQNLGMTLRVTRAERWVAYVEHVNEHPVNEDCGQCRGGSHPSCSGSLGWRGSRPCACAERGHERV